MKRIYIASLHGIENKGGLERVVLNLQTILSKYYDVRIIKKREKEFKHGNWLFQSLFVSLKLFFIPNKIVIGNSWHSFLYPCDFTIHHGTMRGNSLHLDNDTLYTRRVAKMEEISAHVGKTVLAVGENVKDELMEYYHVPEKKILVLNNFVNDDFFVPQDRSPPTNKNIRIVYAGRLELGKGVYQLKKLSDYIETISGFELHIACISDTFIELFKQNKNTYIKVGVSPEEMPNFYNSGDVFYFPTQYEGFSMATLESLCCGIPVVGTKWAIGKELRDYDFTKVIETADCATILNHIKNVYEKYNTFSTRTEIHKTIVAKFGREQYEQRVLELVKTRM